MADSYDIQADVATPALIAACGTRRSIRQFDPNGTEHTKNPADADFRDIITRALASGEPLWFPKRSYRINSLTANKAVSLTGDTPVDIECANEATFIPGEGIHTFSGGLFAFQASPQPTAVTTPLVTMKWRGGRFDGTALTAEHGRGTGTGISFIDVNGYSMVDIQNVTFDAGLTPLSSSDTTIGYGWIDQGISEHSCAGSRYGGNVFRGISDVGIYLSGSYDDRTVAAGGLTATAGSPLFTASVTGHAMKPGGTIGVNPIAVGGMTITGEFVITSITSDTVTFDARIKAASSAASTVAVKVVDGLSTSSLSLNLAGTQSLIQGNRFYRCGNAVQSKRSHKHLLVDFNEFVECINGVRTASVGDPLDEGKWITVSNNVFCRTLARPIVVIGGRKATIWNNVIESYGRTLASDGTGHVPTSTGSNLCAIEIDSVENWSVRDNVITNQGNWATPQTDSVRRLGIKVDAGSKYITRPSKGEAVHNRLENVDQAIYETDKGLDNTFENNIIVNEAVASSYAGYNSTLLPARPATAAPFAAVLTYDFLSGTDGFAVNEALLSASTGVATFTSTTAEPKLLKTGLSFDGSKATRVRMRLRRTSTSSKPWAGRLYWATSDHSWSGSLYKMASPPSDLFTWSVVEWDMAGASDWTGNIITGLRFDLIKTAGDTFEIDYIVVGGPVDDDEANSVSATLSASGTSQATAAELRSTVNVVKTVVGGSGVRLSGTVGLPQEVFNRGANALRVYPPAGGAIENGAADAAVSLAVGGHGVFILATATQCYQGP